MPGQFGGAVRRRDSCRQFCDAGTDAWGHW